MAIPQALSHRTNPFPIYSNTTYHCSKALGPMLDIVYSLRYLSYGAENYIEKNASEKFIDEFDGTPNCASHILYCNKRAIGSIRACVYHPDQPYPIPVMEVFERELRQNVGLGKTMVEANKFVVHPEFQRKGGVYARFSLYKNIIDCALENRAEAIVVAVRPAHVKFYRNFRLEQISDARSYPHLSFPTVLMACQDIEAAQEFIYRQMEKKAI